MTARLLIVTGLNAEARLAAGSGCVVIAGGGDRAGLARRLAQQDPNALRAVISFGLAGALDPSLAVGDLVLGNAVVSVPEMRSDDARVRALTEMLARRLTEGHVAFRRGSIAGVDQPASSMMAKSELARGTGAIAVDMESHIAAAYAVRHGLPFAALRVISDGAGHEIPPVAASAMRPDGSVDVLGIIGGLVRAPGQLPALIATARHAAVAFSVLRRVSGLLDLGGGLLGLDL